MEINLITGKLYRIVHSRRGTFIGKCIEANKEFPVFEITSGEAQYKASYNKGVGEEITIRASFCRFFEYTESLEDNANPAD